MRILILHMRYAPDPTGTGPLVTDLARGLVERGDEVTVVTTAPHYGRSDVPARYRWRMVVREDDHGVDLRRTAAFPWWSSNPIGRAIDYGLYALMSLLVGLGVRKPQAILAVAPPITVAPVGWLISRIKKAPVVFNAQDVWPDGLVQMGRLGSGPLLGLLRRMERWVYSVADRVVVVSEGMKRNLEVKGVPTDKVLVQRNWVDTHEIQPVDGAGFRARHQLEGRFVVLFAGNLGFAAGLDTVLHAAERLRDDSQVCILLVGEGSAKEGLMAQAKAMGLENVRFLTTQPRGQLNSMLSAADLGLVTLRSGMGDLSVPSKTYTYMAAALPVLAAVDENSEIRLVVEEHHCGRWVAPEAPAELVEAIEELKRSPDQLNAMGERGRAYAVRHLEREQAIEGYRSLLRMSPERQA